MTSLTSRNQTIFVHYLSNCKKNVCHFYHLIFRVVHNLVFPKLHLKFGFEKVKSDHKNSTFITCPVCVDHVLLLVHLFFFLFRFFSTLVFKQQTFLVAHCLQEYDVEELLCSQRSILSIRWLFFASMFFSFLFTCVGGEIFWSKFFCFLLWRFPPRPILNIIDMMVQVVV